MSQEQFVTALRALAAELTEAIVGCDALDLYLDEILNRSAAADRKAA